MPFTLTMPKLSPTMEEGQIVQWHKKEGDQVEAGDLLFEVATDKATVEHYALDPGYLRKILISSGETTSVNQAVAIFTEDEKESIEGYQQEVEAPAEAPKEEAEEQVKKAPKKQKVAAGVGLAEVSFAPEAPLKDYSFPFPREELHKRVFASPLARRIAEEKGIDLTTIKGSGASGRVMKRDLNLAQKKADVTFGHREHQALPPGSYQEEPLTPMRRAIAQKLQQSKTFVPHYYVSTDVDVDPLVRIREELKVGGLKLSYNDFVVRASALALRDFPVVNSGYHAANGSAIRFQTVDISIAVSIPDGLITPIVRYADAKNIGELSSEVKELAKRARDGKLEESEYKGGSFTISNLGMYGVNSFQAIINPPQAAILAVGGIRDEAVVRDGRVVPGKRMMLTLSIDHRVIDGAEGAEFIKRVQHYIESPSLLLV